MVGDYIRFDEHVLVVTEMIYAWTRFSLVTINTHVVCNYAFVHISTC